MSDIIEMEKSQTAIAPKQQNTTALSENSPAGMMMAALDRGATLEQVEKMMDLQERWEANEARKAYNDALASFKAEAVEIIKRKEVDFKTSSGRTTYKHAELADVVEAVGPALSKHGFSWSWTPSQSSGTIKITCTLRHRLGHAESVSLEAPPDQSGGKNTIQAIISTKTYLERQTLKSICGVAEKGEDTDGNQPANTELGDSWVSQMAQADTTEAMEATWTAGCKDIDGKNDLNAFKVFRQAYADKKKMLKEEK